MNESIFKIIENTNVYQDIQECIKEKVKHIGIFDEEDSMITLIILNLLKNYSNSNMLYICNDEVLAKNVAFEVNKICKNTAFYFPPEPVHFYFLENHSKEISFERLKAIKEILFSKKKLIIITYESLLKKVLIPQNLKKFYIDIKIDDVIEMDLIIEKLVTSGYERTNQVDGKGQFSVRGGIVDIFNVIDDNPIRIEFFDDEIDSIRVFDVITQRSIKKINRILISPTKEILFDKEEYNYSIEKLADTYNDLNNSNNLFNLIEGYKTSINNNYESLVPYYPHELCSIIQYFNEKNIFILNQGNKYKQQYEKFIKQLKEDFEGLLEKGEVLPTLFERIYNYNQIQSMLNNMNTIEFQNLNKSFNYLNTNKIIETNSKQIYSFYGRINDFIDQILEWKKHNYNILILQEDGQLKQIQEMLIRYNLSCEIIKNREKYISNSLISIVQGSIRRGFIRLDDKVVLINSKEIFNTNKKRQKNIQKKGKKIDSFTDLKIGDYVVHDVHGIGTYLGIEQISVEGIKKDYLHIKYAKGDKLYIPIDQIDSVQVYIGIGDRNPKINKLGSNEWKKTKQKAKKSVQDMAEELIRLYAERKQIKGYSFSKDSHWIKEFEEQFPYDETNDQIQAIYEVKKDMEGTTSMDRLLCGDVGYGKTEVAIRAAFKSVMDSKQVAILVPTTILAQQHYNNIVERFSDYPIKIEMLSRFRTKKQQDKIIDDIKKGRIDIIIGTHRILSNDVIFKDLGLLIIDEEQRFGVKHKEKIKEFKINVDVLTLSATPIPRTLHMSLIGARDMSILDEPPHNRTPIQTYVMEYNEVLLKDAIAKELNRKGQVFYVYNRVQDIERIAQKLRKIVPYAKIVVAHGQMSEVQLENIMVDFMNKKYDILICTTIIESGMDIGNVNTIIIENADNMGLSQLYQLRGRVGRTDKIAYAYITYKKDKVLSEIAEKRLKAIKEFTEFGSGFKIAMRDLEIRGAGNMLGSQQHGHLISVGYDMYCKLLDDAVKEIRGIDIKNKIETTIELNVNAFIPSYYVNDEKQKYELYKRLVGISSLKELYDIEEEIEDRFGNLPKSVMNLLYISYIKSLSIELGIIKIKNKKNDIIFTFSNEYFISLEIIKEIFKIYPIKFNSDSNSETSFSLFIKDTGLNMLIEIKKVLEEIKRLKSGDMI